MVKEGRALRATSRGRVLSAFLQRYFAQYVDYEFTSDMESLCVFVYSLIDAPTHSSVHVLTQTLMQSAIRLLGHAFVL